MKLNALFPVLAGLLLAGCEMPGFTSYHGVDDGVVACDLVVVTHCPPAPLGGTVSFHDGPVEEEVCGTPDLEGIDLSDCFDDFITCPPYPDTDLPTIPTLYPDGEFEDWGGPICGTPIVDDLVHGDWTEMLEGLPESLEDDIVWIPSVWPEEVGGHCGTPQMLDDETLARLLEALRSFHQGPRFPPR